jgi:hypothetical membrane protein
MKTIQPGIFAVLLGIFAEKTENDDQIPMNFLVMAIFLFLFTFVGLYRVSK